MKKIGLFLVLGLLTLGLVACGGDKEETNVKAQEETNSEVASADAEEFTITATNWEFTSDKELTIKKGSNVKLNLVNEEGVHGISNDELGIDLKADKPVVFTADTTGEFELLCSIFCGATKDHEAMKLTLKVVE
ncbi:hypothetical protein [Bacillus sinesaloumensis]|uniref:hypothetical protein n=1 Tax=Litchfieldia sinesaloumensis TaxID=1926280 RepID=UPI0009883F61|nr:hypothetical protein [Bacillus sinesaloumensis]